MKLRYSWLMFFIPAAAGLVGCQWETQTAGGEQSMAAAPARVLNVFERQKRFEGRIRLVYREEDDKLEPLEENLLMIRDEQAYRAFVERIPRFEIGKTNPMPPSRDPLLYSEPPDFSRQMLAVAIRSDNMYVPPEITANPGTDELQVEIRYPPLGKAAWAAQPVGIGSYAALLLPASDKPVTTEVQWETE